MAKLDCPGPALGEIWHRFSLAEDMNCDGRFTIGDVGLWLHWVFFLPGDALILLLLEQAAPVAGFLELGPAYYGGWFSGFLSFFLWLATVLALGSVMGKE